MIFRALNTGSAQRTGRSGDDSAVVRPRNSFLCGVYALPSRRPPRSTQRRARLPPPHPRRESMTTPDFAALLDATPQRTLAMWRVVPFFILFHRPPRSTHDPRASRHAIQRAPPPLETYLNSFTLPTALVVPHHLRDGIGSTATSRPVRRACEPLLGDRAHPRLDLFLSPAAILGRMIHEGNREGGRPPAL
jgi:hypothetical protein